MQFPSHVEWLAERMGLDLEAILRQQGSMWDIGSILEVLCNADPTPGKVAVQWMAERLLDGGFLWEDVRSGVGSKVHETLVEFGNHRRRLVGSERNLSTHASLASVWKSVARLVSAREGDDISEPGIRERRRRERTAARAESIILCERPGLTVAVPMTEMASKWWGRGTRWCTAADKDNVFAAYHALGPLIVIVLGETKMQLHLVFRDTDSKAATDFRDANDARVTAAILAPHWDKVGPFMSWAIRQDPQMLRYIPDAFIDRDMCVAAVKASAHCLPRVPDRFNDREIRLLTVKGDGHGITYISHEERDPELCLEAIMQNGHALEFIRGNVLNSGMCLAAVMQAGCALSQVPRAFQNREICLAAVTQNGHALEFVPEEMRDEEICFTAVSKVGSSLQFVPKTLLNREMCLSAVRNDGWSDGRVGLGTPSAFGVIPSALGFVPEGLRDLEMCLAAVAQAGENVRFVPKEMRTRDMYLVAVTRTGTALRHVPHPMKDRDMCLAAVRQNGLMLHEVPDSVMDRSMCLTAVGRTGGALRLVPAAFMDRDICMAAVSRMARAIQYVPTTILDREICLAALAQSDDILCEVPSGFLDREMCMDAVGRNAGMISFVPHEIREWMLSSAPGTINGIDRCWAPEQTLDGLAQVLEVSMDGHVADAAPVRGV